MNNNASILSFVLVFFLLCSCNRGAEVPHTVQDNGKLISITRSTSVFEFDYQGHIEGEYRIFGFNKNPFGSNNRDDYVASFGLPLLTTHVLIASGIDDVAREYQRTNCERTSADNHFKLSIIAKDKSVAAKLNTLAKKSHKRICARVLGLDLRFSNWILNGAPRDRAVFFKMTKKSGGIDFSNPLLLEDIKEIDCE